MKHYYQACLLLAFMVASCTQPGKVEFPLEEREFAPPKVVEAIPTIAPLPNNLPEAKYIYKNEKLQERDQSIPLEKSEKRVLDTTALKKVENPFKPFIMPHNLPKAKYTWNSDDNLVERLPDHEPTAPKTYSIDSTEIALAKAKVITALPPKTTKVGKPNISLKDACGIRNFNQDHGLPGTAVTCMAKDGWGRIWIGTDNGLALLEGGSIKSYDQSHGLAYNYVTSLAIDGNKVWIGTEHGLSLLENGTFTNYTNTNNKILTNERIWSLLPDGDKLWVGTGRGLFLLKNNLFIRYNCPEKPLKRQVTTLVKKDDSIWVGDSRGLYQLTYGKLTYYGVNEGLVWRSVKCLYVDGDRLWIGTSGGISLLENREFTHYTTNEGLSKNNITSLTKNGNQLWIGTKEGINVLEGHKISYYTTNNGLINNSIFSLLADNGKIWVGGGFGGGLSYIKPKQFRFYTADNGLSNSIIRSVSVGNGAVWVGTQWNGFNKIEEDRITHYTKTDGVSDRFILDILVDGTQVWILNNQGIDILEGNRLSHLNRGHGLIGSPPTNILKALDSYWIGTYKGGLVQYKEDHLTHYTTQEGLISNAIDDLATMGDSLWVATQKGLNLMANGQIATYTVKQGLSNNHILCLLSEGGRLWIGTLEGLNILENGQVTQYKTENGLSNNTVTQLVQDSLGHIWVGTGKGLNRFTRRLDGSYDIKKWGRADGLSFEDFMGPFPPIAIDRQGTIWSGGGAGLLAFTPPKQESDITAQVFLTSVTLGSKRLNWHQAQEDSTQEQLVDIPEGVSWKGFKDMMPYWLPKKLSLPHNQDHLIFHFSGLKLDEPSHLVYRYMLEGLDEEWSEFTQEEKADYRNIPPGKYSFKVRARGQDYRWSEEASFSFTIIPPWWQTPWAYIIYAIAFILLIRAIVVLNSRRLKQENMRLEGIVLERTKEIQEKAEELEVQNEEITQQNEEITTQRDYIQEQAGELESSNQQLKKLDQMKRQLTGMVAHDLKTPLSFIVHESEKKDIKRQAQQMLLLILNMLDVQKMEEAKLKASLATVPPQNLLAKAKEQVRFLASQRNIQLRLDIQLDPTQGILSDRGLCERVVINLLTNAIKFSPLNSVITIRAEVEKERQNARVSIIDQGAGIPADKLGQLFDQFSQLEAKKSGGVRSTGLGLAFCKLAVEAQNGQIGVESELGKGTTFWFSIPLSQEAVKEGVTTLEPLANQEREVGAVPLNGEAKAYLSPYVERLKPIEVYDFSLIEEVLNDIDSDNPAVEHWKSHIQLAVDNCNEEQYAALLEVG